MKEKRCIGWALSQLKEGKKVQRIGWNGKGMYLVMVVSTYDYAMDSVSVFSDIKIASDKFPDSPDKACIPTDPYIVKRTAQGTAQPGWLASQSDLLAEDWQIF